MDKIINWVKEKGYEFQHRNKELDLKICPFCKAKSSKTGKVTKDNMWTFSINLEKGYYKCLRGSCGKQGHINTLAKKRVYTGKYKTSDSGFKENLFIEELKKQFTDNKPQLAESNLLTKELLMDKRNISSETLRKLNCFIDKRTGDLIIPAYEEGLPVNFKRRFIKPIENSRGTLLKTINSKNGKNVLYGMQNAIEYDKPLVIVEGDYEYLSLVECGYDNVVSIPSGASSIKFLENCYEFLDGFKEIILWYDNDEAGEKGKSKLAKELTKHKLKHIVSAEKDANEVLIKNGKDRVLKYIKEANVYHIEGIRELSSIERKKLRDLKRISSGIFAMDYVMKGIRENEFTILSGKTNHGKSTLLGQLILNIAEVGENAFLFSGELAKEMIKEWLYSQACSVKQLVEYKDELTKRTEYEVSDENFIKINNWIKNRVFLYDKEDCSEDKLLELMERAYYQNGCRHFFLDNLMVMTFTNTSENIYRKQSVFVNKLNNFKKKGVHITLVVHPFKTDKEILTKDDIGGTGDISNMADNIIIVHRLEVDEKNEYPALVNVAKGRVGGIGKVFLDFNEKNKRFYSPTDIRERDKEYSWVDIKNNNTLCDIEDIPTFDEFL